MECIFLEYEHGNTLCLLSLSMNTTNAKLLKSEWVPIRRVELAFLCICTDGEAAMIEWCSDFTEVKEVASECKFIHSVIEGNIVVTQRCHLNLKTLCD